MSADLMAFLSDRLDEDEQAARGAGGGEDLPEAGVWVVGELPVEADWHLAELHSNYPSEAEHIARHDPARVLADVAAKQRIVASALTAIREVERETSHPQDPTMALFKGRAIFAEHVVLRLLASVYADHEDYREEWKP